MVTPMKAAGVLDDPRLMNNPEKEANHCEDGKVTLAKMVFWRVQEDKLEVDVSASGVDDSEDDSPVGEDGGMSDAECWQMINVEGIFPEYTNELCDIDKVVEDGDGSQAREVVICGWYVLGIRKSLAGTGDIGRAVLELRMVTKSVGEDCSQINCFVHW